MTIGEFKATHKILTVTMLFGSIVFAFSLIMLYILPFIEIGFYEFSLFDLIGEKYNKLSAEYLRYFMGIFLIIIALAYVPMTASKLLNKALLEKGVLAAFSELDRNKVKIFKRKKRAENTTKTIIIFAIIAICALFIGIISVYLGRSQIASVYEISGQFVKLGSGAVWALVLSVLGNGISASSKFYLWHLAKTISL